MAHGARRTMASRDIILWAFISAILCSTLGETSKSEPLPEFLAPLENHTVIQGRDVSFTCVVNHLQDYKVAWIKADSHEILAIHTHMVAFSMRMSVTYNGYDTWKLHVTDVQPEDSGAYMCQVNTDPMKYQTGYMKVVIPPNIVDLDDSADLTTTENGDLWLRCRATGSPKPVITWRREDGRNITLWTENGVKRVVKHEGELMHLADISRKDMGSYLCIASNGVPPTVSKRYYVNVQFKPTIKVASPLVRAPLYSDVTLLCFVESSRGALNTWRRNNGMKLLPGEKHQLSELTINDYAYQLNLTIKEMNKSDLGTYTCSAENAFGKAEGTIRLLGINLTGASTTSMVVSDFTERVWRKYSYASDGVKPKAASRSAGNTDNTKNNGSIGNSGNTEGTGNNGNAANDGSGNHIAQTSQKNIPHRTPETDGGPSLPAHTTEQVDARSGGAHARQFRISCAFVALLFLFINCY